MEGREETREERERARREQQGLEEGEGAASFLSLGLPGRATS